MKLFLLQQDAKREGRREGRQEGRQEGEMVKVISLTRKKIAKSLSVEEIAEVLEEDAELIRMIAEALEKEPQKSDADIYELIHQEKEGTV